MVVIAVACNGGLTGTAPTGSSANISSTAVTPPVTLNVPAGVTAKCGLTVLTDRNLITRCRFTNTTAARTRFLYCMMMDLRSDLRGPVPGLSGDHVRVQRSGSTVSCTKQDATGQFSETSFHFGCVEVDLEPGASIIATMQGATPYQPPAGLAFKAQDFLVTYADSAVVDPADTYDGTNCRLGANEEQAGFVTFDFSGGLIGAYWVVAHVPFVDPYIVHQPQDGPPAPKEYALFDDAPCTPTSLDVRVADLEPCPDAADPPPPTEVEIKLFYFVSESAPEGDTFPSQLEVETRGDTDRVRVEIDPAPGVAFDIPGGDELYGTLRVCASEPADRCEAPSLGEGSQLDVIVNVLDSETGELRFPQVVRYTADTEPPVVDVATVEGNELVATVRDATTSPLHATAMFETDGTWRSADMSADPALEVELEEDRPVDVRQFRAQVPEPRPETFVLLAQDSVFNLTFYGPHRLPGP
jgi:hypothetical protein